MGSRSTRRQFVGGMGAVSLGLLVGCGRLPWLGQSQAEKTPKVYQIGFLTTGPSESITPPAPGTLRFYDIFLQGLRDYGYIQGQNVAIEYRATVQGVPRLRELAAELAELPVDLLIAGPGAAVVAKETTNTIPIVFVGGGDPVALGLVPSVAHPGGNITGVPATVQGATLFGKRLELLKQVVPGLSRVGILEDANTPISGPPVAPRNAAAQALGLQLQSLPVHRPDDLVNAFEVAAKDQADGLMVLQVPLLSRSIADVAELAVNYRIPSIGVFGTFAEVGGLMSYGPSVGALYYRAAYYVDRILNGTKPADLPVEQPMTFDFVVNMKTARELGITFPHEILLQVTEVVE